MSADNILEIALGALNCFQTVALAFIAAKYRNGQKASRHRSSLLRQR